MRPMSDGRTRFMRSYLARNAAALESYTRQGIDPRVAMVLKFTLELLDETERCHGLIDRLPAEALQEIDHGPGDWCDRCRGWVAHTREHDGRWVCDCGMPARWVPKGEPAEAPAAGHRLPTNGDAMTERTIEYDLHRYSYRQIWRLLLDLSASGWHVTLGVRADRRRDDQPIAPGHWRAMAQLGTTIYGPLAGDSPWQALAAVVAAHQRAREDAGMSEPWYAYLIVGLAIAGTALNVMRLRVCWLVWMASNVAAGLYLASRGVWTQAALQAVFCGLGLTGWYAWGQQSRGHQCWFTGERLPGPCHHGRMQVGPKTYDRMARQRAGRPQRHEPQGCQPDHGVHGGR